MGEIVKILLDWSSKSKVIQGHLEMEWAKGISDQQGPDYEWTARKFWKTGAKKARN